MIPRENRYPEELVYYVCNLPGKLALKTRIESCYAVPIRTSIAKIIETRVKHPGNSPNNGLRRVEPLEYGDIEISKAWEWTSPEATDMATIKNHFIHTSLNWTDETCFDCSLARGTLAWEQGLGDEGYSSLADDQTLILPSTSHRRESKLNHWRKEESAKKLSHFSLLNRSVSREQTIRHNFVVLCHVRKREGCKVSYIDCLALDGDCIRVPIV